MLSGIIAYQILRQENPQTIDKVKALLEKHPWYATQSTSRPPARVRRILARWLRQRRELNYNGACLEIIHIQDAIGLKKRDKI
jgi:predicted membrane chloride channel (bestrophin family)